MADPIKACMVMACGLVPQPVVKIERIISVRSGGGLFLPAIDTKAALDQNREYSVVFPIFTVDAAGEEDYDKMRALAHQRVDKTFDAFKERWDSTQKVKELKSPKAVEPAPPTDDGNTPTDSGNTPLQ